MQIKRWNCLCLSHDLILETWTTACSAQLKCDAIRQGSYPTSWAADELTRWHLVRSKGFKGLKHSVQYPKHLLLLLVGVKRETILTTSPGACPYTSDRKIRRVKKRVQPSQEPPVRVASVACVLLLLVCCLVVASVNPEAASMSLLSPWPKPKALLEILDFDRIPEGGVPVGKWLRNVMRTQSPQGSGKPRMLRRWST